MDGGPRRSQSRSVINRSSEARSDAPERPVETTPPPVRATPPPAPARSTAHRKQSEPGFFKKHVWSLLIIIALLLVIAAGFCYYQFGSQATAIDSGKYQAVFFTNGQVYFGKLHPLNKDYMTLTDVYYLQSDQASDETGSENPQSSNSNQKSMQLVKLGKEIHGPEDKMVIAKDQLLFYENLKPDGKVATSIAKYNQGQ